jgi:hypothetical protein
MRNGRRQPAATTHEVMMRSAVYTGGISLPRTPNLNFLFPVPFHTHDFSLFEVDRSQANTSAATSDTSLGTNDSPPPQLPSDHPNKLSSLINKCVKYQTIRKITKSSTQHRTPTRGQKRTKGIRKERKKPPKQQPHPHPHQSASNT